MGGIVDMVTGESNRKAASAADRAGRGQEAIAKRLVELFDQMMGRVQGAERSGMFDPEEQLRLADRQTEFDRSRQQETNASTARILGYRPGDSVPLDASKATNQEYDLRKQQQRYDIRQNAFGRLLSAYQSVNPNSLSQAGNMYGNVMQGQLNRMQDPSNFFRTALSFFPNATR